MKSILSSLAAVIGIAGMNQAAQLPSVAPQRPRNARKSGKSRRSAKVTQGARRYPEQSSRQAMRGQRRAQGGPGIVLVDGAYVPRSTI